MTTRPILRIALLSAVVVTVAAAQTATSPGGERLTASFRDPSRPGLVRLNLVRGGVNVVGYAGKEVIVEFRPSAERGERDERRDRGSRGGRDGNDPEAAGLRRIIVPSTGISIEEENNVMSISTDPSRRALELRVQVPVKTSLKIQTIHNGALTVENVEGDLEVSNLHGPIALNNVAGSVVAHALHGTLTASIRSLAPNKPLSFSSLHGKIDVTLPAALKATFKIDSGRGDVYSDFDVVLGAPQTKVEETGKDNKSGKYRVTATGAVIAQVNGGGQEITFKNLHGDILIRKSK